MPTTTVRDQHVRRALGLEYLTVGWNVVEGVVAVVAALAAGSVALLGFGVDSFVETASGSVLIWRLLAERRLEQHARVEHIERRAQVLVAASLLALAVFIVADAARSLVQSDEPSPSTLGIAVTALSLAVMWVLARAKRRVAVALGSRAMKADAFQTTVCWWLSLAALIGVGLNAVLGWWWADPTAALVIAVLLGKEARASWQGEDDCC